MNIVICSKTIDFKDKKECVTYWWTEEHREVETREQIEQKLELMRLAYPSSSVAERKTLEIRARLYKRQLEVFDSRDEVNGQTNMRLDP